MIRKARKLVLLMLIFCMTASVYMLDVSAGEVEPEKVADDCEKVVKSYDYDVAIGYIDDKDETTYPKMDNYLFAGWYTDKECTTGYWGKATPKDTVYALFVPSHILSVKAQVSANLLDESADQTKGAIRFVTTVDTLLYSKVGFDISYEKDGATKEITRSSNVVYEKLYAVGKTSEKETYTENGVTYRPWSSFCQLSTYFKACTINKIPQANYADSFTLKPFWYTLDGSKVYGETTVKSISEFFEPEEVYVSVNGNDETGTGTADSPFATLNTAIAKVRNGGTVHIIGDVTVAADATWEAHGKSVTITNDSNASSLDFSAISVLSVNDGVTFEDINLKLSETVYAEGNDFIIASDVQLTNDVNTVTVYGGGQSTDVTNTNVQLYAGSYLRIYGGGHSTNVNGNTNVIIGTGVNADSNVNIHYSSHEHNYMLFGGCHSGTVSGNTYVTVEENACFEYIYGAGHGSNSMVNGSANITFRGNAFAIFGGCQHGTNADTHVVMEDGEVYQIFGGCEADSMTGNTNVQVLGGTVNRRIYGGCYNDNYDDGRKVTGHTNVLVGATASILLQGSDANLCAVSRYGAYEKECGTFIFNEDSSYKDKTGGYRTSPEYHYRVLTNGNNATNSYGNVYTAGGYLHIVPQNNYAATITIDNNVRYYTEGEGYYPLPELTDITTKKDIVVTFGEPEDVYTTGCEARINGAYYNSFEEAVDAVTTTDPTVITLLQENIEVESVTTIVKDKNILINVDKSLSGKTVTINRSNDFGSMFNVNVGGRLTVQDVVLDGRITAELEKTEGLTASSSSLIVCNGTLNLDDVTVQYAIKSGIGGALYIGSEAEATSTEAQFINNKAVDDKNGGAVYCAGTFEDANSSYIGNAAKNGGAIFIPAGGDVTLVGTTSEKAVFEDNQAMGATNSRGGAIFVNKAGQAGGSISVTGYTFEGNTSTGTTACAVHVIDSCSAELKDVTFQGTIPQKIYVLGSLDFDNLSGAVLVSGNASSNFVVSGYQDGNEIEITPYTYADGTVILNKADAMDEEEFQAACGAILVTPESDGNCWYIDKEGQLVGNPVASIKTGKVTEYYSTLEAAVAAANGSDGTGEDESIEIVVLQDVSIGEKLEISKNVTILNDSDKNVTISRGIVEGAEFSEDMFKVAVDATLTLGTDDKDETGKFVIDGATTNAIEGRTVTVESGATFTLAKNATLQNANCKTKNGAAVYTESVNTSIFGTIQNNATTNNGGGLYVATNANATIQGATFSGNQGGAAAGGLYIAAGATVECENATFSENKGLKGSTYANSGAVYCAGTFTDTNSSYIGNEAKNGGAFFVPAGGSVTLTGTDVTKAIFKDNAAVTADGGAIFLNNTTKEGSEDGGDISVTGYIFENNTGATTGSRPDSAVYAKLYSNTTLINVTFQGNTNQKLYIYGDLTYNGLSDNIIAGTPTNKKYVVASITGADGIAYYQTLSEAVAYVNGNGGTQTADAIEIIVLENASINAALEVNKNTTIVNYSGKNVTISRSGQDVYDMFKVAADATLTLGTNDTEETGKIVIDGTTTDAIAGRTVTVASGATFTLGKNATLQKANSTLDGAAIYTESANTYVYGTLYQNVTSGSAGALDVRKNAAVTINGAVFSENEAATQAGAIIIRSNATVTCTEAKFLTNKSPGNGGAVWCAGTFTDTDSKYSGNEAKNGGAIFANNGSVALTGTDATKALFENNKSINSDKGGGAIYVANGTVSVEGYIFEGNTSDNEFACAIYIPASKAITLKNVVFQGSTTQNIHVLGTLNYSNVSLTNAEFTGAGTFKELTD